MKTFKKKIKIIVEKTGTRFSAYSEEFPIFKTGRTIPELINNVNESAQLYFEDEYEITHDNLNSSNRSGIIRNEFDLQLQKNQLLNYD